MPKNEQRTEPGWRKVALAGAATGVALDFAYALAFIFYAIIRTSVTIISQGSPDAGLAGTLIANAASLAISTLSIALTLAIVPAAGGLLTALLARALLLAANGGRATRRAAALGIAAALALALPFQALVLAGLAASRFALPAGAYLLWLGLPGLIHLVAGGVAGRRLNERLAARPVHAQRPVEAEFQM